MNKFHGLCGSTYHLNIAISNGYEIFRSRSASELKSYHSVTHDFVWCSNLYIDSIEGA